MSSGYGATRVVDECDSFVRTRTSQGTAPARPLRSWQGLVLGAALVGATLGLAAAVLSSRAAQEARLATLEHHLIEMFVLLLCCCVVVVVLLLL